MSLTGEPDPLRRDMRQSIASPCEVRPEAGGEADRRTAVRAARRFLFSPACVVGGQSRPGRYFSTTHS